MEPFAAGIVPYIIIDKKYYFLLGLEKSRNNWSGFVGGSEKNETIMETALREFHEETAMIFEDYTPFINEQMRMNEPKLDISPSGKNVYIYIIEFPVDCQENIQYFINKKATFDDSHYHEKSILRWFTLDEIKKSNRIFSKLKQIILVNYIETRSL
jgi:8-oxo-dGTP pyrophosphatase MutT (NUDIX family)